MGTPIALLIRNEEKKSSDYEPAEGRLPARARRLDLPREVRRARLEGRRALLGPGDRNARGRGRDCEEDPRRAAGSRSSGYTLEIAGVRAQRVDPAEIERNPARAPDPEAAALMVRKIEEAKAAGDSVGGIVEVVAARLPRRSRGSRVRQAGSPPRARPHVRGRSARGGDRSGFRGHADARLDLQRRALRRGGADADAHQQRGRHRRGISTGSDIVVRAAIRPPASISLPQRTVDARGNPATIEIGGRHDPCIVPRAVPVLEAMVALVLADCLLVQEAYERGGAR